MNDKLCSLEAKTNFIDLNLDLEAEAAAPDDFFTNGNFHVMIINLGLTAKKVEYILEFVILEKGKETFVSPAYKWSLEDK